TQFQPLPGETTRVVMPVFLGCDGPMAVTCPAYSTRAGLDPWMLPGVANEPPQHPPRLRCRADLARQPAAAAALGGQRLVAGADVAAHVAGAEFRVELQAPDPLAPAEGMRL